MRRVLALFGAIGVTGMVTPTEAASLPERGALEQRVAEMRRHLQQMPASRGVGCACELRTLLAQTGRWNNWPNWSNWANWRNG